MEKEELIIYLAGAKETISAVLMTKKEAKQMPIYFVSRALKGPELNYTSMEKFDATNNEAEYEALIARLKIAEQMGVKNLQANVDSRLVANQVNGTYVAKEADMIRNKEKSISEAEILAVVEEEGDTWMNPIFEYLTEETLSADEKRARAWGIDIAGPFLEGPGKVKFLIVDIDYFTKWIEAKPVATITGNQDNPFKDWCEKLCIRQHFASVKHPQTNGLVERANRSLGEGIKARLRAKNKNWLEELSHVLWAHRTMIKSSNGETPFSLTYGTEAVFPAEIGMPTLRM
ncbi:reverse transcriptase domain-containing protein [Tanacetum coccineum]